MQMKRTLNGCFPLTRIYTNTEKEVTRDPHAIVVFNFRVFDQSEIRPK